MSDTRHIKEELRHRAQATKDSLINSPDLDLETILNDMGAHIAERLGDASDLNVAGYWPLPGELDPRPIMWALMEKGATILLPVIINKDAPLQFRRYEGEDRMTSGRMGIMEPDADCPALQPNLVLTPLMAFDSRGHRLGFGGGYYDRSLEALRASNPDLVSLGIALDGLELNDLPNEPWDQPMDAVLTESGWRDFDKRKDE